MLRLNENGTVRLAGLQPEMDTAMYLVEEVLALRGVDTVITAGTEEFTSAGKLIHSVGSYHPRGYALDFRSRGIPREDWKKVIQAIKYALREVHLAYDAVVEGSHFHVEFDLKKAFREGELFSIWSGNLAV